MVSGFYFKHVSFKVEAVTYAQWGQECLESRSADVSSDLFDETFWALDLSRQASIRSNRFFLGLHLSPAGYKVLYDEYTKVVTEQVPELSPGNLPFRLPPWDIFPPDWTSPPPPQQR
jgi:hypothetical protein